MKKLLSITLLLSCALHANSSDYNFTPTGGTLSLTPPLYNKQPVDADKAVDTDLDDLQDDTEEVLDNAADTIEDTIEDAGDSIEDMTDSVDLDTPF